MKYTILFKCDSQGKYLIPATDPVKHLQRGGVLCWAEVTLTTPTCSELTGSS